MRKAGFIAFLLVPSLALAAAFNRPLSLGSHGTDVTSLQQILTQQGFLAVEPTGYFGTLTQAAVQAYQKAHNIVSAGTPATTGYGAVGPKTLASLNGTTPTSDKATLIAALMAQVKVLEAEIAAILAQHGTTTTTSGGGGSGGSVASSNANSSSQSQTSTSQTTSGGGGGGGSTSSGNSSGTSSNTADTQAPTTPTGLIASAVSTSQINLSWTASIDNVGVTGYKIYRNGTQIGTATTNSYSNTGLIASTNYSYTVAAYDAAGNTSAQSASASAMTQSVVAPGGSCPKGTSYPDGCSSAQANGSVQVTNFFTGYTGKNYGTNRPLWNVAGVDYPVGYSGVLKDPSVASNVPACATYASNSVTIISAPCTISHLDFSLHGGIGLRVSSAMTGSGTLTITNNKFAYGSAFDPLGGSLISVPAGLNVNADIEYNTLDGIYSLADSCSGGCPTALIVFSATGNLVEQYNALLNANQHSTQFNGAGTWTFKYNYANFMGLSPSHGDEIISNYSGSGTQTVYMDYNTSDQPSTATSGGAFCYITNFNNSSATITGECNNNTFVSVPNNGNATMSYVFRLDPGGRIGAVSLQDNWVDPTGSYGTFEGGGTGLLGPVTCSNNRSLLTGDVITYSGAYACNVSTDTTAPSTPAGLTASAISTSQINLSWTASTDNVGVTGYKIYRNGTQIGTSATNSYGNTGLTASTAYSYTVAAYDAAGNTSAQSAAASATTQAAQTSGSWPGQSGNPVGYAAYGTLGTTPWSGGSFQSGTAGSPMVYKNYVFSGGQIISCNYCNFVSDDFNEGTGGVLVNGSNITFAGDRFQSNDVQNYNVEVNGSNITFSYDSITPLASFYTSPPGEVWPSAGAGQNIIGQAFSQTTDVNAINGNDGYEYGIAIQGGAGPVTIDHSDFWGFGNAIPMLNSTAQITITNNWIHDAANAGPQGYHTDGPGYLNGGAAPSNVLIQGNTIASLGNTNGIAFQQATSGYNNIQVIGNYLSGFGYNAALSLPGISNLTNSSFKNNVFGTDVQWVYGPIYGNPTTIFSGSGNVWSGNTFHVVAGTSKSGLSNFSFTSANDGNYIWPDGTLSATDFATAAPVDTTPPVITITAPTGQLAAGTTQTTLSVTTNENATCAWSNTAGTAFASMTQLSTTGGTTHSTTLSGLTNGSSYTTYVKCKDTAGNISTDSSTSYSVANTTATSGTAQTIFLTSGTSWTVPSDWNSANNSIEVIGGGGGGATAVSTGAPGSGGGGGAYSKITNASLTAGATIAIAVGSGGSAGSTGGDTYLCNSSSSCASVSDSAVIVGAKGGSAGGLGAGGSGGAAASGVGATKYSGGAGGTFSANTGDGGGGGGGAAGPNGNGSAGGGNSNSVYTHAGEGGGGAGGASSGAGVSTTDNLAAGAGGTSGNGSAGGAGGDGSGAPPAANGTDGSQGSGGGGAGYAGASAGKGGAGIDWDTSHGAGGGGGGGSYPNAAGGSGGLYGGGGGGGGHNLNVGGVGAPGIIVIKYTP